MPRRKKDDNGFEEWGGYMEAKKAKLEEQFCLDAAKQSTSSDTEGIFKNISIFVNGYTIPSADELKRLMIKYGGIYHHYYRSEKTTHVIASNLPDTKIKQLNGAKKIVKPEWIVDSIAKGKLLDYRLYLLYTNQSKTQPKLFLNFNLQKSNSNSISLQVTNNDNEETNTESISNFCVKDKTCSNYNELANSITVNNYTNKTGNEIDCIETTKGQHNNNKDSNIRQNVAKTASESSFLSEFYSNSRLHHISTMGAIFKQYISRLRSNSSGKLKGVDDFKEWLSKQPENKNIESLNDSEFVEEKKYESLIMHIDMDCFFVSVGIRKRPDFKGCPVAVTHAKAMSQSLKREGMNRNIEFNLYKERAEKKFKSKINKSKGDDSDQKQKEIKPWSGWGEDITDTTSMSEIASCNYEARNAGLKNGMFLGQALKLCPNLKTIPYDFEAYKEVSYTLYNTVASYTLNIEAVSCDEMFVDCTDLLKSTSADPMQLASFLRQEIKDKTGCSCSTGFGSNRLLARLATKRAKPDGQFYLAPEEVLKFMETVKVSDIPGVGRATSYKLSQLGIITCMDLQKMELTKLQAEFGKKNGETLFKNCRGQDDRPLIFCQERKSVSAEVNYGIRFETQTEADNFLRQLITEVHSRLQEVNKATRCITLKLMIRAKDAPDESAKFLGHGVCDYTTKSSTLAIATSDSNIILREVLSLNKQLSINPKDLRGIGIQLSRLDDDKKHAKIGKDAIDKFLVPKVGESSSKGNQEKFVQNFKVSSPSISKVNISPSVGISHFFKSRKPLKEAKKSEMNKPPPKCIQGSLDKDVLMALPEDIRQEVLREYGLNDNDVFMMENKDEPKTYESASLPGSSNTSSNKLIKELVLKHINVLENKRMDNKTIKKRIKACDDIILKYNASTDQHKTYQNTFHTVSEDFKRNQIVDINKQHCEDESIILQIPKVEENEDKIHNMISDQLSSNLTLTEIRTLIREWVSSEASPQTCDTDMLKNYLQQLVVLRQLENLDIALRCLYRCIANRNSEEWENTYFTIVNKVQDVMLTIYGAKLFVQNSF